MMTCRKFADRCTQLAIDIERNAGDLGEEVPEGLTRDLRAIAVRVMFGAEKLHMENAPVQQFLATRPATHQAQILSLYAEARELASAMAYEAEQLDLCYAL